MNRATQIVGLLAVGLVALLLVVTLTTASEPPQRAAAPSDRSTPDSPTTPSPTSSPEPEGPPLLLPNMRSLDAGDLQIERRGEQRLLRFSAELANLGPGPLLLRPSDAAGCPPGRHPASQVLHADRNGDGVFQRGPDRRVPDQVVGCMLKHPRHDHWHFDAMAGYSLRRPGTVDPLVSRDKVSFCLRDNVRVPGQPVVVRREYFGDCTRTSRQGISPGWIDIYTADLAGQALPLPRGLRREVLCLDLEADPLDRLTETEENDNENSVAIRLTGGDVRRAAPHHCA